jgi:hypothetical protein
MLRRLHRWLTSGTADPSSRLPSEHSPQSFFARESVGLIAPPHLAYGLARAVGVARRFGVPRLTVCEFGVAEGAGLLALVDLTAQLAAESGITFRVVGFDSGVGLTAIDGPKDHPELWSAGDFRMEDPAALIGKLDGRAELLIGDVAETVDGFVDSLGPDQPLAFVSMDVDIYTAARSALRVLTGPSERYLPAFGMYLDDVSSFFSNRWCGELAAIEEFNAANTHRKIDRDRTLGMRAPGTGGWHDRMYVCHVLDHIERTRSSRTTPVSMGEHLALLKANPYGYL